MISQHAIRLLDFLFLHLELDLAKSSCGWLPLSEQHEKIEKNALGSHIRSNWDFKLVAFEMHWWEKRKKSVSNIVVAFKIHFPGILNKWILILNQNYIASYLK